VGILALLGGELSNQYPRIRGLLSTRLVIRQSTWPWGGETGDEKESVIAQLKSLVEKL
jgi:hypothetical protein